MKLWKAINIEDKYTITGFLTESDVDEYIKNLEGVWTKEPYEGIKLDSNKQEFFKFFNLPEQEITEEKRTCLESLFCHQWYENPPIIVDGKSYENWGTYTISYYADQWWACGLNKGTTINGEYYLKEIARGEGDSPVDALCSLIILKHDLLEEESLKSMEELFKI